MDYEKKYKEALERAKDNYNAADCANINVNSFKNTLISLFPELKESGDERIESEDEKIRHYLMNFVKINDGVNLPPEDAKKALAWLEKQKDCIKLSDSAYTSNRDVIEFADKYSHTVWEKLMDKFKKNLNYSIGCNDVSDIVLNAIINTYNWLEKQGKQKASYTTIVKTGDGGINALVTRELPTNGCDDEQNPAEWSEEDEHRLNSCLNILQPKTFVGNTETINTKWLKSLKGRVQPKQSEKNLVLRDTFGYEDGRLFGMNEGIGLVLDNPEKYGLQKPIKWSKDDERERKRVVGLLEGWLSTFKETCYAEDCKCGIDWLKSLRPQPHWCYKLPKSR